MTPPTRDEIGVTIYSSACALKPLPHKTLRLRIPHVLILSLPSELFTKLCDDADLLLLLFRAAISPSRPEIFIGDLCMESGIDGSFLPELPSPIILSRSTLAAARMCALGELLSPRAVPEEPRLLS